MNSERSDMIGRLFPEGIPTLWCPPLTHFTERGEIDEERMRAHLTFLSPWVSSFLLPGTTGEGWELSDEESARLLRFALGSANAIGFRFLIGILRSSAREMVRTIEEVRRTLGADAGGPHPEEGLRKRGVAGITVCPPAGEGIDQAEIGAALREVLTIGLPTALYQLPQVTRNEIEPRTAAELAEEFSNLYLIKDSSGDDRLASSGLLPRGLFLVRGAEGGYFEHHRLNGGAYDGFLLSTANCFARELATIVDPTAPSERRSELSVTVTTVIEETFEIVKGLPAGNPFTNANKAIDHFNAYGERAERTPPPRLSGGSALPTGVIERTARILDRHGLRPRHGYLDGAGRHSG